MSQFEGIKSVIDEYSNVSVKKAKKQNPQWYTLYYEKNKDKISIRQKKYYLANKDKWLEKNKNDKKRIKAYKTSNPNHYRDLYRKNRQKALDAYGGKCACCGEDRYEFLAIDHINNNGKEHRSEMAKTTASGKTCGDSIYRWLKRNQYPSGFQVLCHNCNMAKAFYGTCPHKKIAIMQNNIENEPVLINYRKSFSLFCDFVNAVKSGRQAIAHGSNYVVMDKKTYNNLVCAGLG